MVGVAQLVEPWIVAPVVAGSSPVAHPILIFAPVAQLDRVPDFESVGRRFESCRARFIKQRDPWKRRPIDNNIEENIMHTRKISTLIALLAVLLFAGQPAFADPRMMEEGSKSESGKYEGKEGKHEGGYGHGEGHGMGHSMDMAGHILKQKDKLGLTADQVTAIENLRADYKKVVDATEAEHMAAHKELQTLAHADTIDEAGMHAVAEKISVIKNKMIHSMVSNKIALLKVLTPEQRKKMQALHEDAKKEMEKHREEMMMKHGKDKK